MNLLILVSVKHPFTLTERRFFIPAEQNLVPVTEKRFVILAVLSFFASLRISPGNETTMSHVSMSRTKQAKKNTNQKNFLNVPNL